MVAQMELNRQKRVDGMVFDFALLFWKSMLLTHDENVEDIEFKG